MQPSRPAEPIRPAQIQVAQQQQQQQARFNYQPQRQIELVRPAPQLQIEPTRQQQTIKTEPLKPTLPQQTQANSISYGNSPKIMKSTSPAVQFNNMRSVESPQPIAKQ